ncbi:MAG: hypothetical protein R2792_17285 [Saprospiraceae bacterium]
MKIKANLLLLVALMLLGKNLNPVPDAHLEALASGLDRLNLDPDMQFADQLEYHDYIVVSFTMYLGKPISIGALGNVHVLYNSLEEQFMEFYLRNSVLPNQGRGAPEISI